MIAVQVRDLDVKRKAAIRGKISKRCRKRRKSLKTAFSVAQKDPDRIAGIPEQHRRSDCWIVRQDHQVRITVTIQVRRRNLQGKSAGLQNERSLEGTVVLAQEHGHP